MSDTPPRSSGEPIPLHRIASAERLSQVAAEAQPQPVTAPPLAAEAEEATAAELKATLSGWLVALRQRLAAINDTLADAVSSVPGGAELGHGRPAIAERPNAPRLYPTFQHFGPLIEAELDMLERQARLIDLAL